MHFSIIDEYTDMLEPGLIRDIYILFLSQETT